MTSRDRLLVALDHREGDRVPIDLGGNQTGIHKFAYQRLVDLLGLREGEASGEGEAPAEPSFPRGEEAPAGLRRREKDGSAGASPSQAEDGSAGASPSQDGAIEIMGILVQQLAKPSEAVLERLHVDTRYVAAGGARSFQGGVVQRRRNGRLWNDFTDEFGVTWSMPEDNPYYFDISRHPLAGLSLTQIQEYPFPKGDDPSRFEGLRDRALLLRKETPYAIISGISGVVYEICWYLRGLENLFIDMLEQPQILEAIIDRTLKFWMDWFRLFLDEAADVVDVIMIGDDLCGQDGPLYMPGIYRSIVKPRQKTLVQYIKSRTRAKIWYHTCGSVLEYLPDLLDNGIDILNPVQISARGMDPAALKAKFGDRLSFWGGGIDAQHILPTASPEEVRDHVRRNVEALKPGGGYVFNNVHNIQADVPPENVVAMFDAAFEFGRY